MQVSVKKSGCKEDYHGIYGSLSLHSCYGIFAFMFSYRSGLSVSCLLPLQRYIFVCHHGFFAERFSCLRQRREAVRQSNPPIESVRELLNAMFPKPTSGETIAPITNPQLPNAAAPQPTFPPAASNVFALDTGCRSPNENMQMQNAASTAKTGACKSRVAMQRSVLANMAMPPALRLALSERRTPSMQPAVMPIALRAKQRLNCMGVSE